MLLKSAVLKVFAANTVDMLIVPIIMPVTTFLSGGAIAFEQIAASLIISKKDLGTNIRLVFILPCRNFM